MDLCENIAADVSSLIGLAQYMTYTEFRRLLGKAGLTAKEFAGLLSLHPNSITNYSSQGEVPLHFAVIVTLMSDMAEQGLDFRSSIFSIGQSKLDITA